MLIKQYMKNSENFQFLKRQCDDSLIRYLLAVALAHKRFQYR
jgi:hypothetical protein